MYPGDLEDNIPTPTPRLPKLLNTAPFLERVMILF